MALTPEDVVNKRFQPTKFREGYDQDEVDDFLDEVVVELRRLGQENEDLRQRLIASESRIAELQRSGASSAPAAAPAPVAAAESAPQPVAAPAPAASLPYPTATVDASAIDPSNTNNLLQL
ncbi:MAG: DivIVA domain-containing protein, partial [Naasia sp.]